MKKNFTNFKLNKKINKEILKKFDDLKNDKFLKSKWIFRKRSFAKAKILKSKIIWQKQTSFFQAKKNNKYIGGVKRNFYPMSKEIRRYIEEIILNFFEKNLISSNKIFLGAHAIRIVCNKRNYGYPVPEGFHHDGFDYVSIISVNKSEIKGGKSYLKNAKSNKIVFEKTMKNNEVLFFNDKKLMHYASPIKLVKGRIGFRDVIVLTFHE